MKSISHEFWSSTSYSDFHTKQTFHKFYYRDTELDFHQIMNGYHETFATGVACQHGTLILPNPGSIPFVGACICSDFWDQCSRIYTNAMTLTSDLTFTELREVYMDQLRQVWHASRERLPSGHLVLSLLRLADAEIVETSFLELPYLFSTFHLEYPSVLSRFYPHWHWDPPLVLVRPNLLG